MRLNKFCALGVSLFGLLAYPGSAFADAALSTKATQTKCEGASVSGTDAPTPADPYPLNAAGWGPEAGNGLLVSRWAEDWSGMRKANHAPPFKAMPVGEEASLTLSSEMRLRYDTYESGQLTSGNDYQQTQFRGVVGADLRLDQHLRVYGEIATGQVEGRRDEATANFQNDASLQQLFVDVRHYFGSTLAGAMVGRQEYADGPRQLISLSDGPNIHRTWNGVRAYVHKQYFRVGLFDLRATQQQQGTFDEEINNAERIQGINTSLIFAPDDGPNTYWDSFWIRSEKPNFRSGGQVGLDERETVGSRLWGRKGGLRFDLTLAHQTGDYNDRNIEAWGLFAVNSFEFSSAAWKPKLTTHIDIASGGGAYGNGTLRAFNPLYASSNYLGEGQALSLSNLLMIAPGFSIAPTKQINLSIEYGFARRLVEDDAVYAGGMRAYTNTQNMPGYEIGGLLRVTGSWSANKYLTLSLNYEHLDAGDLLKRAHFPSGSYGYLGATFRY